VLLRRQQSRLLAALSRLFSELTTTESCYILKALSENAFAKVGLADPVIWGKFALAKAQ
jgi:hypothetical protein